MQPFLCNGGFTYHLNGLFDRFHCDYFATEYFWLAIDPFSGNNSKKNKGEKQDTVHRLHQPTPAIPTLRQTTQLSYKLYQPMPQSTAFCINQMTKCACTGAVATVVCKFHFPSFFCNSTLYSGHKKKCEQVSMTGHDRSASGRRNNLFTLAAHYSVV